MQDNANIRLQMINTLQQECVIVQGAIDHLINCRKRLEENIAQAKAQVSSDATDALDTLRAREIQLLRQIDVIESHHANALLVQHAKLNQLLGNLKHTLYCARHHQNVPVNSVSDEDMEVVHEVNRIRESMNPLVTFYCDMNQMVAAIQNFGAVESTGHMMRTERDDVVSRCLPSRVEEYEDGEHQLLYKTLGELKLEAGDMQQICVAFPKLSAKKEDWLRMDSHPQNSFSIRPNFVLPENLVDSDKTRWLKECGKPTNSFEMLVSKDGCIENWLRRQIVQTKRNAHHQQQQPLPPPQQFQASDVVPAASSDCPYSCSASESIEMISNPDSSDSANDFTWLANPAQQSLAFNTRAQTKKEGVPCRNWNSVDIENLASVSCGGSKGVQANLPFKDHHLWLSCKSSTIKLINEADLKNKAEEEDDRGLVMAIDQLCCANEPCRSFSECVCDVSCDIRNSDKNRLKLGMSNVYSELNDWLKNPMNRWLKYAVVDSLVEVEKMDVSEKLGETESTFRAGAQGDSWLKNYQTSIDEIPFNVRQDFLAYFKTGNLNQWLAS